MSATKTFRSQQTDAANATIYSAWSAITVSAADTGIVVGVNGNAAARTCSSVTVTGNNSGAHSATKLIDNGSTDPSLSLWLAPISGDTSITISVTFSGSESRASIIVWSTQGMLTTPSQDNSASIDTTNPYDATITVPAGGLGFAIVGDNKASSPAIFWSGFTKDAEITDENSRVFGGASASSATDQSFSVEANYSAANNGGAILVVTFGQRDQTLTAGFFGNSNSFPSASVGRGAVSLVPSLLSDADSFPASTVSASNTIAPPRYADPDTFYAAALVYNQSVAPSFYSDSDAFPAAALLATYSLAPGLVSDGDTFPSPSVQANYAVAPALFSDADSFPASTVSPGPVSLAPSIFTDSDNFPAAVVLAVYGLSPAVFLDADVFFAPAVTASAFVLPQRYDDADTFPPGAVSPGPVSVAPALFSDGDAFPPPSVTASNTLRPALFADADIFPVAAVSTFNSAAPPFYSDPDTFWPPIVGPFPARRIVQVALYR